MRSLRLFRSLALWLTIALPAAFLPPVPLASAASYVVPPISKVQGTLPASILAPETHLLCFMRSDMQPSKVQTRSVCYQSHKPDPPPSLPITNFQWLFHQLVVGAFIEGTGELLLPVVNCTEFFPGFAVSVAVGIQLNKGGGVASGSNVVTVDTTAPFDCADGTVTEGPLTLTPLADDHDEDGDFCDDWDELGDVVSAGGLRDPFNPWDYFNPLKDSVNRIPDIVAVQQHFGIDQGDPRYSTNYDRGQVLGPNVWNLDAPNGTIRISDIVAIQNQFGHDCAPPA